MQNENHQNSRLVLGTAQLGMDYGISNKTGKPDIYTAKDIVSIAWEGGIRHFDTAQAYGESEKILGIVLKSLGLSKRANVITKLDPIINHSNKQDVTNALMKSLENLQIDRLYGLLLHQEELLDLFKTGLADALQDFILQGFVEHIGISFYSPTRAKTALEYEFIRILQIPANIWDHRFDEAGILNIAEKIGAQTYIRSIFLQGLLLMDKDKVPEKMRDAYPIIEKTAALCKELGMSVKELTLGYIKWKYPNSYVIIGAETVQQVMENTAIWNVVQTGPIMKKVDEALTAVDERIINPSLWPH